MLLLKPCQREDAVFDEQLEVRNAGRGQLYHGFFCTIVLTRFLSWWRYLPRWWRLRTWRLRSTICHPAPWTLYREGLAPPSALAHPNYSASLSRMANSSVLAVFGQVVGVGERMALPIVKGSRRHSSHSMRGGMATMRSRGHESPERSDT